MSNLPKWNLADFYPNFKSKDISNDIDKPLHKSKLFQKSIRINLKFLSGNKLINHLKTEEKIYFIKSFSFLTHCTDQLNKEK